MCIEAPQHSPHLCPQSLEWLLAWPWIHRVLPEVVEENAVDNDEADHAPLHDLGPLVPRGVDRLGLYATLELALKAKLLLLCQLAKVRWPSLFDLEAVARKVEGRQCVLVASEQAIEELQHCADWRFDPSGVFWTIRDIQILDI